MRRTCTMLALCLCLPLAGCGETKPPPGTLPEVTLMERSPKGSTMLLRFCFTRLDRVNWTNKVLRVRIGKTDAPLVPVGPKVGDPGPEFTIKVLVGKPTETDRVLFIPTWGKSKDGIIAETVPFDFAGTPDSATVEGARGRRLAQVLQTCTGPNRTVPFDPVKGLDLVTVGYGDDAYSLKVWVGTTTAGKE